MLARFLDHADGKLARLTGKTSRFGHYYDFAAGALSSAALFIGIGVGLRRGIVGEWSLAAGIAAGSCALIAMGLGLGVEARQSPNGGGYYPAFGGFELEDGIYLVARSPGSGPCCRSSFWPASAKWFFVSGWA